LRETGQRAALLVGPGKLWLCGLLGETDRRARSAKFLRLSVAERRSGGIAD